MRLQVCPSINLGVIKRVLCYFTPDEFCPDPVPGEVLEALNAEVEKISAFFFLNNHISILYNLE